MSIFAEPRMDTDNIDIFISLHRNMLYGFCVKNEKNEKIVRESVDMYDTVSYIFLQRYDIMS